MIHERTVLTLAALVVLLLGCSSASDGPAAAPDTIPARADLSVVVDPNPIQARLVSGDTYDFPFTVTVRENNGVGVEIDRVTLVVTALGAIPVYSETMSREEIAGRGYPTSLRGGGELRYSFTPRKEVDDDRLFGGVAAELRAEGTDANGNVVTAQTRVTVRR